MKELSNFECEVNDDDVFYVYQDKLYPDELEFRICNRYTEESLAVVLGKDKIKEFAKVIIDIL